MLYVIKYARRATVRLDLCYTNNLEQQFSTYRECLLEGHDNTKRGREHIEKNIKKQINLLKGKQFKINSDLLKNKIYIYTDVTHL